MVPAQPCVVSYTDPNGFRHSVEVQAGSLYEAVAIAVKAFRDHDCAPGPASLIEVEVKRPGVRHSVTMRKVQEWAEGTAKSPAEIIMKKRLKAMLNGQG